MKQIRDGVKYIYIYILYHVAVVVAERRHRVLVKPLPPATADAKSRLLGSRRNATWIPARNRASWIPTRNRASWIPARNRASWIHGHGTGRKHGRGRIVRPMEHRNSDWNSNGGSKLRFELRWSIETPI